MNEIKTPMTWDSQALSDHVDHHGFDGTSDAIRSELDRLREENAELINRFEQAAKVGVEDMRRIEKAERELDRAREALKPFAKEALKRAEVADFVEKKEGWEDWNPDHHIELTATVKECQQANAALTDEKKEPATDA